MRSLDTNSTHNHVENQMKMIQACVGGISLSAQLNTKRAQPLKTTRENHTEKTSWRCTSHGDRQQDALCIRTNGKNPSLAVLGPKETCQDPDITNRLYSREQCEASPRKRTFFRSQRQTHTPRSRCNCRFRRETPSKCETSFTDRITRQHHLPNLKCACPIVAHLVRQQVVYHMRNNILSQPERGLIKFGTGVLQ